MSGGGSIGAVVRGLRVGFTYSRPVTLKTHPFNAKCGLHTLAQNRAFVTVVSRFHARGKAS